MTDQVTFSQKKRVRSGHRSSTTRLLAQANDELQSLERNLAKLQQLKVALLEKLDVLRALDAEIVELSLILTEDELDDEILQADTFTEKIRLAVIEIDAALSKCSISADLTDYHSIRSNISPRTKTIQSRVQSPPPQDDVLPESPRNPSGLCRPSLSMESLRTQPESSSYFRTKVRLPKLSIKKFNGNLTAWTTFWDSFESTIHLNPELTNIDKFNYLNSLLEQSAAESISGLTLTNANYEEAVAVLKKRYGNKQQIISTHMDALLNLEAVTSHSNFKSLRYLRDQIESHIRSLKSLGIPSESYGSLLSSVLMSKLPQELRLIVSRWITDGEWNFEEVMAVIEKEIDARERAGATFVTTTRNHGTKDLPTAAALFSGDSSSVCCSYCGKSHSSVSCKTVIGFDARKQVLTKIGRCFLCLRKHHMSRDCKSTTKCYNCSGRHHTSICSRTAQKKESSSPSASDESVNHQRVPKGSKPPVVALYVDAKTPVLLQIATTGVLRPDSSSPVIPARMILDSGSQRSYITNRLKTALSLPSEQVETMLIKNFGSVEEKRQNCDVVRLAMKTKTGECLELAFLAVPLICEPLSEQPIMCVAELFPHISGLDLADPHFSGENLDVNILIGSDHYWEVATGNVMRGVCEPTAIETKFGWVLSGSVHSISSEPSVANLVSSHVLRLDASPDTTESEANLDMRLKKFWD